MKRQRRIDGEMFRLLVFCERIDLVRLARVLTLRAWTAHLEKYLRWAVSSVTPDAGAAFKLLLAAATQSYPYILQQLAMDNFPMSPAKQDMMALYLAVPRVDINPWDCRGSTSFMKCRLYNNRDGGQMLLNMSRAPVPRWGQQFWSPTLHVYLGKAVHERVWMVLMCCRLPSDVVKLILQAMDTY